MDQTTANNLAQMTSDFYAEVADSFSDTRKSAWSGWERALNVVIAAGGAPEKTLSERGVFPPERNDFLLGAPGPASVGANLTVVDLACGNMRFEKWLQPAKAFCFDNCEALVPQGCEFTKMDLLHELPSVTADLCVCFGFMHHVPTPEWRAKILDYMAQSDVAIVTFWQFLNSEKIAAKAEKIGEKDYLLGWQERTDVKRYCHFYTNEEIAQLMSPFDVIAEFQDDGTNHNLNHYVVFEKSS